MYWWPGCTTRPLYSLDDHMRWRAIYLYIAFMIFLASAAAILLSLERGSRRLAIAGAIGNVVAGVLFMISLLIPHRTIDWERIETEQRLWESGPLGRRWLGVRRRISDRWRL